VNWLLNHRSEVLLSVLAGLLVFVNLGKLPLQTWDESRLAENALEAALDGHWFVSHYEGQPDLWNTKPPLLTAIQGLFIQAVGPSETAVRLPSAMAAVLLILAVFRFVKNQSGDKVRAWVAAGILATSALTVGHHNGRTGDYDALLSLFLFIASVQFYFYCTTKKNKHLYLSAVLFGLAVLTKGIAGCLHFPSLLLLSFVTGSLPGLLRSRAFYIAAGIFFTMVASFYLSREMLAPGYLEAVWNNELGGRFASTLEGNRGSFGYYFDHLVNGRFGMWWILLIPALVISYQQRKTDALGVYGFTMALPYLLVISFSETKLEWYDLPALPFLAIVCSFIPASAIAWVSRMNPAFTPASLAILLFCIPVQSAWNENYSPSIQDSEQKAYYFALSSTLRSALEGHFDLNGYKLVHDESHQQFRFYQRVLETKGIRVTSSGMEDLIPGDSVLLSMGHLREKIGQRFQIQELMNDGHTRGLLLLEARP